MEITIFVLLVAVLMLQVYDMLFSDMRRREKRYEQKLDAKVEAAMDLQFHRPLHIFSGGSGVHCDRTCF